MSGTQTHFGFSKLLVNDLEAAAAFYASVCGLTELARVDSEIAGRPISEIMYNPTGEGAATFVLLQFTDGKTRGSDEVITGFQTNDLDAFVARVEQAGGSVVAPIKSMPEHGVRVAFVADPEGHLIEVVELLAG
ncbi:VOC family protein [Parahaliea mediterranea]|uniref:VOC family protein n=1 Tax=Parahaliea mediterranea TaxID=651086 RepID=UPI000E2F256C|nr:VOC family protein [Parahaliea mediterranea]